jgi:hypothetical protein
VHEDPPAFYEFEQTRRGKKIKAGDYEGVPEPAF